MKINHNHVLFALACVLFVLCWLSITGKISKLPKWQKQTVDSIELPMDSVEQRFMPTVAP